MSSFLCNSHLSILYHVVSHSFCLSVYLSVCLTLSVSLSHYLSIYLSLIVSMPICLYIITKPFFKVSGCTIRKKWSFLHPATGLWFIMKITSAKFIYDSTKFLATFCGKRPHFDPRPLFSWGLLVNQTCWILYRSRFHFISFRTYKVKDLKSLYNRDNSSEIQVGFTYGDVKPLSFLWLFFFQIQTLQEFHSKSIKTEAVFTEIELNNEWNINFLHIRTVFRKYQDWSWIYLYEQWVKHFLEVSLFGQSTFINPFFI